MKKQELKELIKECIQEQMLLEDSNLLRLEFKLITLSDSDGNIIKGHLEQDSDERGLWWIATKKIEEGQPFWENEVKSAGGTGATGRIILNVTFDNAGK